MSRGRGWGLGLLVLELLLSVGFALNLLFALHAHNGTKAFGSTLLLLMSVYAARRSVLRLRQAEG
jgi:hypothetical protein